MEVGERIYTGHHNTRKDEKCKREVQAKEKRRKEFSVGDQVLSFHRP